MIEEIKQKNILTNRVKEDKLLKLSLALRNNLQRRKGLKERPNSYEKGRKNK